MRLNVEQFLVRKLRALLNKLEAQLRLVAHQPVDGLVGGFAVGLDDFDLQERAPPRVKTNDGTKTAPFGYQPRKEPVMSLLKWALIFLLISLVAALFGFTGISAATADIARILFFIFVVIFLVLLVLGLTVFRA